MASGPAFPLDSSLEGFDQTLEEPEVGLDQPVAFESGTDAPALSGGAYRGRLDGALLPQLSVLLPALNEEGGVRKVLRGIPRNSLRRMGFDVTVQLLDGGSSDRTREYAENRGAGVYVQKGWGKGSAFREFLPTLRSDYCVILDPDATYPPQRIPAFANALRDGAPVVLGSRLKWKIHDGAMTAANKLGNLILSRFASILYRRAVSDVCSGMWGFRTEILKSFAISANGFDLEANLFAECVRRVLPIIEVPIPYYRRIGSPKLRLRTGLRIAWALLRNRIRFPE